MIVAIETVTDETLFRLSMSTSSEQSIDLSEELATADDNRRCLVSSSCLVLDRCHFNTEKAPQGRLCYSPVSGGKATVLSIRGAMRASIRPWLRLG